jgi:DNA-binding HxlR family transcriptional regulator
VVEERGLCRTYLAAMEVLAKPWNGMLMAVLEEGGPFRFGELSARVPSIGDRMLAARLKELEQLGLVVRRVEPGPPVRVLYSLTEVGLGYRHVAEAVRNWGALIVEAQTARQRAAAAAARPARRAKRAG